LGAYAFLYALFYSVLPRVCDPYVLVYY